MKDVKQEEDDESIVVTVIETDDAIGEYPILLGRNAMVSNSQQVTAGELLTDGGRVLSIVCQDKDFDMAFEKAYKYVLNSHFISSG